MREAMERDELYPLAVHVVRKLGYVDGTVSFVRERLQIDGERAERLVERMRREGVVPRQSK